jgi:hypothetical protein
MISDAPTAGLVTPRVASQMTAEDTVEDEGGFDYGWPEANVALADPLFSNLLMRAEVNAVGYAVVRGPDGGITPMLLLTGVDEGPLREVFALFARWQSLSGPGAIHLEIAFDGAGFRIAVLPDSRSLRWRCCGFGNISRPDTFNLAWVKAIDTRSDFLDSLADYGRGPFAPVYLGAAIAQTNGDGLPYARELDDVPTLLLPSIQIHRRPEDIPLGSFLASDAAGDDAPPISFDPSLIAAQRAWRLPSIMPKTIHVLRHTELGCLLVDRLAQEGVARWQVEQAIANLRLGALADFGEAPPQSHWMEIHSLRLGHIELAEQAVDLGAWTVADILDQIRRDARFLLRRIANVPATATLAMCQTALREAGYA